MRVLGRIYIVRLSIIKTKNFRYKQKFWLSIETHYRKLQEFITGKVIFFDGITLNVCTHKYTRFIHSFVIKFMLVNRRTDF